MLTHKRPPVSSCIYFGLWVSVTAARILWHSLCESSGSMSHAELPLPWRQVLTPDSWQSVTAAAADAQALAPPLHTFLSHSLSCVPVLVLGLIFLEGALALLL